MKTTVDIPDQELKEVIKYTQAKTKREAIITAISDYNRRQRVANLVKVLGTFSKDFPSNDEIEKLERDESKA